MYIQCFLNTFALSVFLTLSMPTGNSFFFLKTISICFFALGISFCYSVGYSQSVHPADNEAFIQNEVATVHISIAQNYLNNILHPDSLDSNTEYPATFIYSSSIFSDTVDTIGFRLRGNTSRYAAKKSFKIAFNSYTLGQKWKGLEKLNLNGEHNDPSILRSYISAYLLKSGNLPSPRNSYVELYINGEYKGLYYNNEHIDEEFIQKRFINNDDGNLFKANYGADLTYLGTNPNNYDNFYEQKTNGLLNGYAGLIHFLEVLNTSSNASFPCLIQEVLDVDHYLKTLAVEVLSGHWDGHAYNKNNFYLYQRPSDNKFILLQYDMDNTFGIDWMSVNWATRTIYDWSHPSQPRPLYNRMMDVPYFKDRFTFYVDSFLNTVFNQSNLLQLLQGRQTLITPSALADAYREMDYGFSDSDFLSAITQAWGGHVTSSLSSYITNRYNTANNQTIYLGLTNPCAVSLPELSNEKDEIIGIFSLIGQPVNAPPPNQAVLIKYKSGKVEKRITIE